MTLTIEQRRTRAAAILAESERSGCGTLAAIATVNARIRGETTRPAARPAKGSKRAARITAMVRESLAAQASAAARAPAAQQAPGGPLHKMSADELMTETAAAYRAVGGVSPYWVQEAAPAAPIRESAPPGVKQGPAGAVVPTVSPIPVPAADPLPPLHNMSSEDWEAASAAWFLGASQAGHPSPFWQAS